MTIEFTAESAKLAFLGGLVIGMAATILLLFNGRISGICGITNRLLMLGTPDRLWRMAFIAGLIMTGYCFSIWMPESFMIEAHTPLWRLALAGLLVGYGASLGNGCTSGHGVCGVSRGSKRSITATLTFMTAGFITVFVMRIFGVYP